MDKSKIQFKVFQRISTLSSFILICLRIHYRLVSLTEKVKSKLKTAKWHNLETRKCTNV